MLAKKETLTQLHIVFWAFVSDKPNNRHYNGANRVTQNSAKKNGKPTQYNSRERFIKQMKKKLNQVTITIITVRKFQPRTDR